MEAFASRDSLRADSAGIRGEVFPGDHMLTMAIRNISLSTESLPQISLGARILLRLCQALVWPMDLGVFGAHLPTMNDQVSNMQPPAQPWWLPGNAGRAPYWVKIGQVKAQGTTMLSQLISVLPIALNAANYCWWKATLSPPFDFFFFLIMQISTALYYCLNLGNEKGEKRRNDTCPWWYRHCQTHKGGSEMPPLSLVLIPLGYKDVTDTAHVLFLHSA